MPIMSKMNIINVHFWTYLYKKEQNTKCRLSSKKFCVTVLEATSENLCI